MRLKNFSRFLSTAAPAMIALATTGCANESDTEIPPPLSRPPGGVDAAPPDDEIATSLTNAAPGRPCGDQTVGYIERADGVAVSFCAVGDNAITVGELVPQRASSVLEQLHPQPQQVCPADLFRALAPDRAVPQELEQACEGSRTERLPVGPARTSVSSTASALLTGADYCGPNGASNFVNDACKDIENAFSKELRSYYCIPELWGWHDRAMSWQLAGSEGDSGDERVAACGGSSRFRAFWRWDVGDHWVTSLDVSLSAGDRYRWLIFKNGGEDIDVRFMVDSLGGTHRHAGIFINRR